MIFYIKDMKSYVKLNKSKRPSYEGLFYFSFAKRNASAPIEPFSDGKII
jgi:hypothetical protein